MSIQNLILGNLVSRGADRLLNPNRKNVADINKFTGGGYFGTGGDEDNKDKGPTTFGGIAKTGIMSLLAQAFLGPIFGPLALTLGRNFMDRRNQGLGLIDKSGDPSQIGPQGGVTATGMQFADIQDTLGSTDSGTDIDYNTGDITDAATGITTGNVYDEVALTGGSGDDSGSNGGGGGGSPGSAGPGGSDEMGSFRYGGIASLYR
jgi:hypothetical protein|tara:strand:+ start:321 stop:935 length:615 start_codon:yes stop_codon:yes gene_type:complete